MMNVPQALQSAQQKFPFAGYMEGQEACHSSLARLLAEHVPAGGRILDFGSGPCDKTAIFQLMGYQCTACDDLQDYWHGIGDNRQRILSFAEELGINFELSDGQSLPDFAPDSFDAIMLCDVLEHLHNSPRDLLNGLLPSLREGGHLLISVPNAVNLRKRLGVLLGKTNLPNYASFYWHPGNWRGHVREYVYNDLALLAEYLNLETVVLRGCDHMLARLPRFARSAYAALTNLCPTTKDSLLLLARKPVGWEARHELSTDEFSRIIGRFTTYRAETTADTSARRVA